MDPARVGDAFGPERRGIGRLELARAAPGARAPPRPSCSADGSSRGSRGSRWRSVRPTSRCARAGPRPGSASRPRPGRAPGARRGRRRRRHRSRRAPGSRACRRGPAGGPARPAATSGRATGRRPRTRSRARARRRPAGRSRSTAPMNPSQAGKPARASSMAGPSTSSRRQPPEPRMGVAPRADRARDRDAQRSAPRQRRAVRDPARPRHRPRQHSGPNRSGRAASSRPRPRSARTRRRRCRSHCGMTTPRTAFVAIAASTAEPPERRTWSPAAVARWCGATTAPCEPRASGTGAPGVAVDQPMIPVTGSSAPRNRARGRRATRSSTAVATSIPSMPAASAANPPISAPAIWPIARKTE